LGCIGGAISLVIVLASVFTTVGTYIGNIDQPDAFQVPVPRLPDGLLAILVFSVVGLVGAFLSSRRPTAAATAMLVSGSGLAGTGAVVLMLGLSNSLGAGFWWIAAGIVLLSGAFLAFRSRTEHQTLGPSPRG
jgi:hypothetical protein